MIFYKIILRFCTLVFLSPIILLIACGTNQVQYVTWINEVYDGDTFKDINNQSYRLLGVDTPEMSQSDNNFKPTIGIEHLYALKAQTFVERKINHQQVMIILTGKQSYNRQVAQVKIGVEDLGLILLSVGLGRVAYISCTPKHFYYYQDAFYIKQLINAQSLAQKEHLGIWANFSDFKTIFPKQNVNFLKDCAN